MLQRPCPECGFEAAGVDRSDVAPLIREVSSVWQDLTARLGYPDLVRRPAPEPVTAPDLVAAVREREGL